MQLYINDTYASVTRPVKELKGFELIELEAGASELVSFTLTNNELGFYNNHGEWMVEPGEFKIYVGGSSMADNQIKIEL